MKRGSPFFRGSWFGTLPLFVWAGHFCLCYVAVALACDQGWGRQVWMGLSTLQWGLLILSAMAVGGLAWLTAMACRDAMQSTGATLAQVRLMASLLSLVATLWTAAPILWLPTCHIT